MAKRSIPLNEIMDSPHSAPSSVDHYCTITFCRESVDRRFGGFPICADHGQVVLDQGRSNARRKPRPIKTRNRHGIPLRGGESTRCCYPDCTNGAHNDSTGMCRSHSDYVYLLVRGRREAEAIVESWNTPEPEPSPPPMGTIYFLRVGSYIKIGWTGDLGSRMRGYPPDSILLATHPGTREDEQRLHKRFAVHRSHGREWYPLAPVIMEHVKRVIAEHGAPKQVDFGAKPVQVPQPRPKQYTAVRSWSGSRSSY